MSYGLVAANVGVAFFAHIGGFVAGLALLPLFRKHDRVDHERWERWVRSRRIA